jgi:hypothetical protein
MATEKKTKSAAKPADKKTDGQACSIKDCKRPYRAKGLCVTHYKLWRRGELEGHKARYKTCSKEGCRKPREFGGLCAEHAGKGTAAEGGGEAAAPAAAG